MIEPVTNELGERVHLLKSDPFPFRAAWTGSKTFEIRSTADRDFRVGDFVLIREHDARRENPYSGRAFLARIPYTLADPEYGVPAGFVIFSIQVMLRTDTDGGRAAIAEIEGSR